VALKKPQYDLRPGTQAVFTARLWIVGVLCAFQYWLLTATMEAFHAGNSRIVLPAFLASLLCFLLSAGLILTGEAGYHRVEQDLEKKPQEDE
jgi:hypothetical protein